MKKENLDLIKQAIVNEYGVSDAMATLVAKAALEGAGKALVLLADRLVNLVGNANEAD